jgi:hypothetical protein
MVERGSRVIKAELNNDLRGTVIEYTGTQPNFVANEAVAPGLVSYLERLIQWGYNVTGINELNAQSQTPAASMSGRARLIMDQNESQRFLTAQRSYEMAFMDLSMRVLEAADDIADETGDFELMYQDRKYMRGVKYSDIGKLTGPYEVQVFPTSIMPSTAAGRLGMVERFEAQGYIKKSQAIELLEFPDLKSETDFETAWDQLIDKRIHAMVSQNRYLAPHPDMPLDAAIERTLKALAHYEVEEVPDERLDHLRQFRAAAMDLLKSKMTPPPAPVAPGPPGMPMAPPAAIAPGGAMPDAAAVPIIAGGQAA